jgi:hypothetical protein
MARVKLELSDDLLRQIDEAADRSGETRDQFLARSVAEEVGRSQAAFRKELERTMGPPGHFGGKAAEWLRWDRDHRDDNRFGWGGDDA